MTGHARLAGRRRQGFNSATALKPWMRDRVPPKGGEQKELQFGHGVEAVDDCDPLFLFIQRDVASIRPRR